MSDIAPTAPKATVPFNYEALEPALARDAQLIATRIRTRLRSGYIATGQDLLGMKERLGHGRFGVWLSAEFAMSERTAQRYMGAAQLAAANSDIVSDLPVMVVEALAAPSLPEKARAVCVERIRAGVHVSPRDIAAVASELRSSERSAAQEVQQDRPSEKMSRAERLERQAAVERRREAETIRASRAQQDLIGLLADALGDKRNEAAKLLRLMGRRFITSDELLDAINRQGAAS